MMPVRTLLTLLLLLAGAVSSQAFLRRFFSDAEIVSRAELIVIGHVRPGSVERINHGNGSSWEHHVELVIDEVLKGQCASNSLIVSIHYGLDPLPDNGRYDAVPGGVGVLKIFDTGNSITTFAPVSGDIGTNQIWLLRRVQNAGNNDSGWLGIYDPEDIQPVSRKSALLNDLTSAPDPIDDLVTNLSASLGLWQNGLCQPIVQPATVPPELLVQDILAMDRVTNYTVLTIRPVTIQGSPTNAYTAALIQRGPVEKIVLFGFSGPGNGWWNRIYDPVAPTKTSVKTH